VTPDTFARDVLAERARLAMLDPEGEREALAPMDGVRARQILLELAEQSPPPTPRRLGRAIEVGGHHLEPDEILSRLHAQAGRPKGVARCPAHEDRHPSLSWRVDGDRVLLYCFAGCSFGEIIGALR
jgi:hypothetical protein